MILKPILVTMLALALFAIPGAAAAPDEADEAGSCAAGGDMPLHFWYLRVYSGQCAGVELAQMDPAPFSCPGPDVLPCGFKLVVDWS